MKQVAGLVFGALLLTSGCQAAHAATAGERGAPIQRARAGVSEHGAIPAVVRADPRAFTRFPEKPGTRLSCPIPIGGPPGSFVASTCAVRVAPDASGWQVMLVRDYNEGGAQRYVTTYRVSADGAVSQPAHSGDNPARLNAIP